MEAGASPVMLPAPPPFCPSHVQCSGGGGAPGTPSVRAISRKKHRSWVAPLWAPPPREGFGLWACLPDPKRALGAHRVPLFGEVRRRRTALTLEPCGARAGYTPPSADVLLLARCTGHGARDMQGTESGSRFLTGSVLESVACEPLPRPTGARGAGWPECSWVQVA